MKVLFINKSDQQGGAAVVTRRLACALHDLGNDNLQVRMLVQQQLLDNADGMVSCYSSPLADKNNFLAERLQIFLHNGMSRSRLFLVDTAAFGRDLSKHEWVAWADVIVLGWINQGAMSLQGIEALLSTGKHVVWMMHDLWAITGICHLPHHCSHYQRQQGCGQCMYLNSSKEADLSHDVFSLKKALYSNHNNLSFIAVSHWVKDCFLSSALTRDTNLRCEVIHNIVPIPHISTNTNFPTAQKGDITLTIGAARIDDPVKGFPTLLAALNELNVSDSLHLVLYGNIRNRQLLDEIPIPYTYKGVLRSPADVEQVMAHSDIILSCSAYETFGATIAEGIAAGCIAVTTGTGGQRDIVDHLHNGYIVEQDEPFANGIQWAINKIKEERVNGTVVEARQQRREEMAHRFAPEVIAKQFVKFLSNL